MFKQTRAASLCLLAILSASLAVAQGVHPKTGRKIAGVMGMGGAPWLERSEREVEEMPDTALDKLGITPGMAIADVGAGVGYFTLRMARRVAPGGKVYAQDIQPEMLSLLRARAAKGRIENVETILGTETDPKLPAGALDLILLVDVYHEFAQPQKMLRKLREALKPTGRLVLLEYRKEDPHVPIRPEHKMSVAEVKLELEDEGFALNRVIPDLPRQHILVFERTSQ
ncbi:MAG: class I SAM-dependent methyltransferase [Acidobacteria bacterium]|nr:class I SAM-dependent methyltransferase [Acidobacteriota bacterium]